jgi:hypothetical protein
MRLFTFLILICFGVLLGVPYGLYVLPDLNLGLGIGLAVAMGLLVAIAVRVMFIAILGGLLTALGLFLIITLAAQYFFFAVERDRWFGNQDELPQQVPVAERESAYMNSLGLTPQDYPVIDWLNHSRYQAESSLAARQLNANQVATPKPAPAPQDIWVSWLTQLGILFGSLCGGVWLGKRKKTS